LVNIRKKEPQGSWENTKKNRSAEKKKWDWTPGGGSILKFRGGGGRSILLQGIGKKEVCKGELDENSFAKEFGWNE